MALTPAQQRAAEMARIKAENEARKQRVTESKTVASTPAATPTPTPAPSGALTRTEEAMFGMTNAQVTQAANLANAVVEAVVKAPVVVSTPVNKAPAVAEVQTISQQVAARVAPSVAPNLTPQVVNTIANYVAQTVVASPEVKNTPAGKTITPTQTKEIESQIVKAISGGSEMEASAAITAVETNTPTAVSTPTGPMSTGFPDLDAEIQFQQNIIENVPALAAETISEITPTSPTPTPLTPAPGGVAQPPTTTGKGVAEALAFGLTEALIAAFPELQEVYNLFVAEKYADARLKYYSTDYYKNLTSTAVSRQSAKATRPGVYQQEFDAWKQAQKVRLAQKGVGFTPDIEVLLEQSYLKGDTDLQLDLRLLDSGKVGTIGGTTLGLVGQLKNQAYEQGVNTLLGADYWNKVSQGLFTGTITTSDVEEQIKNTAISAYPAYADGIQAGRSFNLQTSAIRQTVANLLEMDPDTIGNDNPVFKQLVNYVNPASKKPEQIPLWEAEKIVKKRDEWMYTKNARDTFDSLGRAVLRDMGVAY